MVFEDGNLPYAITDIVWACVFGQETVPYDWWWKKPRLKSSNQMRGYVLVPWTSSKGEVSFLFRRPGTWLSILEPCRMSQYQYLRGICFSMMYAMAIWTRVRQVHSTRPLVFYLLAGDAMILESLLFIHWRHFPLMNFWYKSDWNWQGRVPTPAWNWEMSLIIFFDVVDLRPENY